MRKSKHVYVLSKVLSNTLCRMIETIIPREMRNICRNICQIFVNLSVIVRQIRLFHTPEMRFPWSLERDKRNKDEILRVRHS